VVLSLQQLMLLLRRVRRHEHPRTPLNPVIVWAVDHIEKHFHEPLPLAALARGAGYSRFYLARLFKQHTGLSVKQYILQRRIAAAKLLLRDAPALTVLAVARKTGFQEFALFNRSFKKLTGTTPSGYRNF
ncbi:MAG: helix-turn-helix transcriptional regulator, partial [Kiritimatiellia bacterium]